MRTRQLLGSYPRVRPPLGDAVRGAYLSLHLDSRDARNPVHWLSQQLESWMHQRVARRGGRRGPVLELGAGTLNHVRYEPGVAPYDAVEPFVALYEGRPALERIRAIYRDICEVPGDQAYERVISVATLEHVQDLPACVARAGLLLRPGGVFQAGIPSEGGFLWGLSWRATVGLMFRVKRGLDYGELMRHEHVSTAREIVAVVRHFFRDVRVERFPLSWHHASLYAYLEAREPRLDHCRESARPSPTR